MNRSNDKAGIADVLSQKPGQALEWEAVVPIATNPFILVELLQMCFVGAGVCLVIMASGLWIVGGGLQPGDISLLLTAAAVFIMAVAGLFMAIALIFFGNRYYALYHMTGSGIYLRGRRGHDESGPGLVFAVKPFPVAGLVTSKKTWEKDLPWEKVDRFIDFPEMLSIQLKRGRWHMMRLYTPDRETHEWVITFLDGKIRRGKS